MQGKGLVVDQLLLIQGYGTSQWEIYNVSTKFQDMICGRKVCLGDILAIWQKRIPTYKNGFLLCRNSTESDKIAKIC